MAAPAMMAALLACPLCGGLGSGNASASAGIALMIILMAATPYAIAAVVIHAIRKSEG